MGSWNLLKLQKLSRHNEKLIIKKNVTELYIKAFCTLFRKQKTTIMLLILQRHFMWIFFCLQNFAVLIVNKVAWGAGVIHSNIFIVYGREVINKPHQSWAELSGLTPSLVHCSEWRQWNHYMYNVYWDPIGLLDKVASCFKWFPD